MTWQEREEQAAADLGITREQYRKFFFGSWPAWLIGYGKKVRKPLYDRQHGVCPLCRRGEEKPLNPPWGEKEHVHHLRPRKEFVNLDSPILEALKALWAPENLQLVHVECHKRETREQRRRERNVHA
jgi:5-methylcytosine-specific restriction endonuclease McrA